MSGSHFLGAYILQVPRTKFLRHLRGTFTHSLPRFFYPHLHFIADPLIMGANTPHGTLALGPFLSSRLLQTVSPNHSTPPKYMAPQLGVAASQFSFTSILVITLVANHLTTFSVATIASRGTFSIIIQFFDIDHETGYY